MAKATKEVKHATKLEVDARTRQVVEWILQGYMTSDIISDCIRKWDIGERMAYKYIDDAYKLLADLNRADLEDSKNFHIQARRTLYNKLENKHKPYQAQVALQILQDMARLQSLDVKKVDITSNGQTIKDGGPVTVKIIIPGEEE